MKGLVAVAWREVVERRIVLAAAAIAGIVPFLVPVIRGMHGVEAAEARQWTALILSVSFGLGLALSLGLTTIAGEIANRRIGFYWARPISGFALWFGKLSGAWVLAAIAALVAFVPSLVLDGRRLLPSDLPAVTPGLFLFALVGVVVLSHCASIVIRSRSLLLLADCVAVGITVLATRAISLPLLRLLARNSAMRNVEVVAVAAGIGILAAGAAAVLVGRIQIKAAHRALSLTLWSVVACGLLLASAHTTWAVTARPSSISTIYSLDPGSSKSWVTVTGHARGTSATFVFNTEDGRYARVPTTFRLPAFSRTGNRAVWFEPDGRNGVHVISWRLDQARSKPGPTRLVLGVFPIVSFLSDDGTRLATYDSESLSVFDLGTGALLASARAPGSAWTAEGLFVTPDHIRVFVSEVEKSQISIFDVEVGAKKLHRTTVVGGGGIEPFFSISPDGRRLIVRDRGAERVVLFDGASGKELAVILDELDPGVSTCFLSRDRIAVAAAHGRQIRVLTSDGQIERAFSVRVHATQLLGEAAAGRLSLSLQGENLVGILDLESGKLEELSGLRSIPRPFWRTGADPFRSGGLFCTPEGGSLIELDPVTLHRRVLLGKSAAY